MSDEEKGMIHTVADGAAWALEKVAQAGDYADVAAPGFGDVSAGAAYAVAGVVKAAGALADGEVAEAVGDLAGNLAGAAVIAVPFAEWANPVVLMTTGSTMEGHMNDAVSGAVKEMLSGGEDVPDGENLKAPARGESSKGMEIS